MDLQSTIFFSLFVVSFWNGRLISSCLSRPEKGESIRGVLKSLKKAIRFFEEEYQNVNLDAVFGLRVTEGILEKVSKDSQKAQGFLEEDTSQEILSVYKRVSHIANKSVTHLQYTVPKYYKEMEFLVSHPWRIIKTSKKLNHSLASRLTKQSINLNTQNGRMHKTCVTQLLGSEGPEAEPCHVSNACWDIMVARGDIGYGLTHKALYFMFGEQRGCLREFSRHFKRHYPNPIHSLDDVYDRICSSMFPQMNFVHEIKKKRKIDRDLFMEQGVVCGLLGYHEFLSTERLSDVKQWQLPSGCYGYNVSDEGLDSKGAARRVTVRRLLMTKEMADGCESHITGVATALLGVYLNWLTMPPELPPTSPLYRGWGTTPAKDFIKRKLRIYSG